MVEPFYGGRADRLWHLYFLLFGRSGLVHRACRVALTAGGFSGVAAPFAGRRADRHGKTQASTRRDRYPDDARFCWRCGPIFRSCSSLKYRTGLPVASLAPRFGAISLGLVGRRAMSSGVARNQRFDAAGNALTAAGLGLIAQWFSKRVIFLASHCSRYQHLWR